MAMDNTIKHLMEENEKALAADIAHMRRFILEMEATDNGQLAAYFAAWILHATDGDLNEDDKAFFEPRAHVSAAPQTLPPDRYGRTPEERLQALEVGFRDLRLRLGPLLFALKDDDRFLDDFTPTAFEREW